MHAETLNGDDPFGQGFDQGVSDEEFESDPWFPKVDEGRGGVSAHGT